MSNLPIKLRDIQIQFQDAIKHDVPVANIPIYEANGILKETRIGIYRYAYWTRITDCLSEDFPRTDKLLNDWPFSFEDLVHDFMILEKNNFACIGELSKAFFIYVISTNPRMNQLPILKIKQLVKTLRTDYSCLIAEMSPWSLLIKEYTRNAIGSEELGSHAESAKTMWNKSLQIFDTVLVFQKQRDVHVVDLSESAPLFAESLHLFFELMDSRRNIASFEDLVTEMDRLGINEADSRAMMQFLVENELLFFIRSI